MNMPTNFSFDASSYQAPSFGVLPKGWYKAQISATEMKPTSKGGMYIQVTFDIIDGFAKGRKIFNRYNVVNDNSETVRIAYEQLGALSHAVGVIRWENPQQLHNIPLNLRLKVVDGKGEYDDSNEPNSYANINDPVRYAVKANEAPANAMANPMANSPFPGQQAAPAQNSPFPGQPANNPFPGAAQQPQQMAAQQPMQQQQPQQFQQPAQQQFQQQPQQQVEQPQQQQAQPWAGAQQPWDNAAPQQQAQPQVQQPQQQAPVQEQQQQAAPQQQTAQAQPWAQQQAQPGQAQVQTQQQAQPQQQEQPHPAQAATPPWQQ